MAEHKRGMVTAPDGSIFSYASAKFICSYGIFSEIPQVESREFCVMGRSNVGKSSFINHVLENNSLAHVSKTPGKTRCVNHYAINDTMIWMDLPGYGYAKGAHAERDRLLQLVHDYCENRASLSGIVWLVDSRLTDSRIDQEVYRWLIDCKRRVFPVLTKADKLSKNKLRAAITAMENLYKLSSRPVAYSTLTQEYRESFWNEFLYWSSNG